VRGDCDMPQLFEKLRILLFLGPRYFFLSNVLSLSIFSMIFYKRGDIERVKQTIKDVFVIQGSSLSMAGSASFCSRWGLK